jgi:type IV secretion system protein VirB9
LDYWVAGHQEVSPSGAYDDGRFIYLTFNNNADMPAVYETDESGKDSLVNTHVTSGNTIAIHRLAEKLTLRKGDFVASVWNKSYDSTGGANNLTGTVAPDVERVIKEVN